ncbi:hypothetical protein HA402_001432 [Bradysia odoriphaga]|nr:hypothetical protein HA402_001432 [Bradysia odoriphaga]
MKFKIDKEMLPMKAHYFFFNAGTSTVVPFMPTLIRQLGFSSFIVGTIYTILPVVGLLAKPIFGAIADRFQLQRMLFLFFLILTAVTFFAINFLPELNHKASVELHCHSSISELRYCGSVEDCVLNDLVKEHPDNETNLLFNCDVVPDKWMLDYICDKWQKNVDCDSSRREFNMHTTNSLNSIENIGSCLFFGVKKAEMIVGDVNHNISCPTHLNDTQYFKVECEGSCNNELTMKAITETKINNSNVVNMLEFWLLLLFLALSWAGMAVVVSVGDAICFSMLGERSHLYGNQRLWGSVGWGVFSVIAGLLVDRFSGNEISKNYSVVFYMVVILLAFDFWFSLKIENVQKQRSPNIMKDVGVLFLSLPVLIFFIWCIVIGLCTALIWNFLFWHLENLADQECNQTSWMKTLQGLAMGIQCFGGELPFFFLSGWILRKIGHIHAMSLVLIGFGVRFLLYSVLSNPWWVLPIELLNGVTFGLFYSTMTSYASIVAPTGTEATLQGLVGAIFEGVGVSTGSFIGGIMFERVGGSSTFRIYGIAVLIFCVVHIGLQKLLQRSRLNVLKASATTATLLQSEKPDEGSRSASAYYKTPTDALSMLEDEDHMPHNT